MPTNRDQNDNDFQIKKQLSNFFHQTSMTSTYKPIIFKSILYLMKNQRFQPEQDYLFLNIDEIIKYFFKYNFALKKRYHLKQLNNRNNVVSIYKIIDKYYPQDSSFSVPSEICESAQRATKRLLFRHVLFLLRNDLGFYEFFSEKKEKIPLPKKIKNEADFRTQLRESNFSLKDIKLVGIKLPASQYILSQFPILESAILALLIEFLEKINNVPNLGKKLQIAFDDFHGIRNISDLEKQRLFHFQNYECFYCGLSVEQTENHKMHADHFVPFSYIFDSQIWNIVGSCSACNLKKSNYLVQEAYLEKLLKRNQNPTFYQQFFYPYYKEQSNKKEDSISKEVVESINKILTNLYLNCKLYFKEIQL